MNLKTLFLVAFIVSALILGGCASAPKAPETKVTEPKSAANIDIKSGAQKMRHEVEEFKDALKATDAVKAKHAAEEIEEIWEKFEDDVRAKDKALYGKIEEPIYAIKAGVKASPLNVQVLTDQANKLDSLLANLVK